LANIISTAGTYPNRPATDVDLSFTALQLMATQFRRLVDGMGMPISIKPSMLVIPPELIYIARELLASEKKPYTNDNEINALIKDNLNFFAWSYLSSASAWFVLSGKETHTLKFKTRKALEHDFADDFDTRSVKNIAFMRFAVGVTSFYGTWGSNGP